MALSDTAAHCTLHSAANHSATNTIDLSLEREERGLEASGVVQSPANRGKTANCTFFGESCVSWFLDLHGPRILEEDKIYFSSPGGV